MNPTVRGAIEAEKAGVDIIIMATHPDDYLVFTQMNRLARTRTTPHKIGREALEENKKEM